MDVIDQTLALLDEHTGFSRDIRTLVRRSRSWPRCWMTPERIEAHLRARDFWVRGREQVRSDLRAPLVRRYLEREAATAAETGKHGWVGIDGQYKFRPGRTLDVSGDGHADASPESPLEASPEVPPEALPTRSRSEPRSASPSDLRSNRRRHGRVRAEMLRCQFGRVADLSASGLKVVALRKPALQTGDRVKIHLRLFGEERVTVRVRVVFVEKRLREHVIGCEFSPLTPLVRERIGRIMQEATQRLTIASGEPG